MRRSSAQQRAKARATRQWGHRLITATLAAALAVGALASLVAVAPEVYSPSIAAASNVYTETINGTTGPCSSGWYSGSSLDVPAGVISTQVTMVGGGGGGSATSAADASGGVGGGASEVVATIPAASLHGGSVLYAHLGCGGGAGSIAPGAGAGGVGESDSGAGSGSPTGSGAAGGTAQGDNGGGGGGGGSALCVVAAAATNCSGGTIIGVAGGGGGAAAAVTRGTPPAITGAAGGEGSAAGTSAGGTGSATGCAGTGGSGTCTGGGGGTASVGAAGTGAVAGNPAVAGAGGSAVAAGSGGGGDRNGAGGGGGGGYFGGGGGAAGQTAGTGSHATSGTGGGAASSYWNTTYGGAGTFSNIATTATNCGTLTTQCATSTTGNGSGGTAGHTGASGSLVVKYTVGGVAANSSFTTEPSATASSGGTFAAQPVVKVEDYAGANISDPIQLSIASHPSAGTGTLTCTTNPLTSSATGVAAFAGCSISGPVGAYTLSATDTADGVVVATSSTITLSPGTPTHLAFVQDPTAAAAGSAISPAVTVAVEDTADNVETGNSTTQVSLGIGTNPGGGTLTGGSAVTVSAGIATFSGLSINKTGAGYTLTASSTPSYTAATSTTFNITPGAANRLVFVQGPSNTSAGATIAPPVTVAVEDVNGNVETGNNSTIVSLAFGTNPGNGTLTGGSAVTVSAGIATFSSLSINKTGTGYTLTASSTPSYTPTTSSAFNVSPGTATQLAFVQGPSNAAAGSAIAPAVTVAVEDADGNVETGDNATQVTLVIGTNPGSGALTGGSVATVSAGIATFSGLSINKTGTGYTLTASSSPSYASATSSAFNVSPGTATQLAFVQGPSNAAAGSAIAPAVTVAVEDADGNVETGDNATQVTLVIGTNPGSGALTGGAAVTVQLGIATFSGLSINDIGAGYTLTASSNPIYSTATSSAFNITPGSANQLAFVQGPSNALAGAALTPAVTVAVEDASGNIETADNTTTVSLAIASNPGSGTLTGGAAVTVQSGIATFSGLSINKTGTGYTLTASSNPAYAPITSAAFNIAPGPATQLAFVQSPSNSAAGSPISPAVTVAVEDANGNVETGDNATQVTLGVGTNPGSGTLTGGAPVTVVSGVATFAALSIDKVGTGYTLTASSNPAYTTATSVAFNVSAGTPTHLAFVQEPTSSGAGSTIAPAVTVAVEDANGNVETSDNASQVTLAIGNNPGGGTLSGGAATAVVSGVATFGGLSINRAGTGYTLVATSSPSYAQATSTALNVSPGTATQLAFVQGPSNTDAGSLMTPAVTVAVEDASGNI